MSNQPPYSNPPGGSQGYQGGGYPPPGYPPPTDGGFSDFLTFRKMITPVIIQIIFWIGVALSIVGGIVMMLAGASTPYGGGGAVLVGLIYIFLGPIIVRIYCEILIIIFRMNESLTDIKRELQRRP